MTDSPANRTVTIDMLRRYDRPGPRYTSYPTAPMWNDSVTNEVYRQALASAAARVRQPFALYCHIPFCRSRCFYCGCNTCETKNNDQVDWYLECLYEETDAIARLLGNRRTISQLHFGGGTPTFIGVAGLRNLVGYFRTVFEFSAECEMSIEADPRVTSAEAVAQLRQAGFNRISLGVQDFDADVQLAIGRRQSTELVRALLETARQEGYTGINLDLIYGLPRQTPKSFRETISTTLALRPDRVALYSFAYLPKLRPNQVRIRSEDLPNTETKYRLFSDAVTAFMQAGYRQIGMDHFALPEDELALAQGDGRLHRNFMGYTVQAAPEMIGLGMSSIGYIDNTYVQNASKLETYRSMIQESSLAVYRGLRLSDDDLTRQYVITHLMCNFTLQFSEFRAKFDRSFSDYFKDESAALEPFIVDGLLERDENGLRVTPRGRTFVRNIAMTFDVYLRDPKRAVTFSRTV